MSEIDVIKCDHYNDGNCDKYYDIECADHPECIYKQLQQLKVILDEIKRICKHEIKNLTDSCINGGRYFEIIELIKQVKESEG